MALISNGTTIFDNGSMASGFGGNLIFISKATASASASIEFTSGIDSTYKEYIFYFVNIHPSTDAGKFEFQGSTDGGSSYGVTITSSAFRSRHTENDLEAYIQYNTPYDLAQSTSFQSLSSTIGNGSDQNASGFLTLYNPSSTTFVKHFLHCSNTDQHNDATVEQFQGGYFNTTSAINAIKFQMNSGNIDAGEILLFGIN